MTSNWKEKKKAKKLEALAIHKAEQDTKRIRHEQIVLLEREKSEKERIRHYNREWRRANLSKVAERQRRWSAKRRLEKLNLANR